MFYLAYNVYKHNQTQGLDQCWHELHCSPDNPGEHHPESWILSPSLWPGCSISLIIDKTISVVSVSRWFHVERESGSGLDSGAVRPSLWLPAGCLSRKPRPVSPVSGQTSPRCQPAVGGQGTPKHTGLRIQRGDRGPVTSEHRDCVKTCNQSTAGFNQEKSVKSRMR